MKEILLNTVNAKSLNYKKYSALVSNKDYKALIKFKWSVSKVHGIIYAISKIRGKNVQMHNMIMGCKWIDHKDGNGLNNQRCNLRKATAQQNQMNKSSSKNSTSRFKGVWWDKAKSKWAVHISKDNRNKYLGHYDDENLAGLAYNEAAKKLHGRFAKFNQVSL